MNKLFASLVIIFILLKAATCIAQQVPQVAKTSVVFIYYKDDAGKYIPNGTGFFVVVFENNPKNVNDPNRIGYLVTAKHVLQHKKEKTFFNEVFIRINKKETGIQWATLKISTHGPDKNVFTHEDGSVDLAVVPGIPDMNIYDVAYIPDQLIASKEAMNKLNITEGANVFITGLFISHTGETLNEPIVRFGRVALIPKEKVLWDGERRDLYLFECSVYGGNSGAPAFFYFNNQLRVSGVVIGFYEEDNPLKISEVSVSAGTSSNSGIAAIVPAYKLREILFSEELKKQRGF